MPVVTFQGKSPWFGADVFVAPTAVLIGDVVLGDRANVWYGAVLRGDVERITIGAESIVAAGALVTQGKESPPRSLVMGSPATLVREVRDDDLTARAAYTARYAIRARLYLDEGLGADLRPYGDRGDR